eukprot:scaffold4640_cov63-Phaeocystis_antarctica.AAC.5
MRCHSRRATSPLTWTAAAAEAVAAAAAAPVARKVLHRAWWGGCACGSRAPRGRRHSTGWLRRRRRAP